MIRLLVAITVLLTSSRAFADSGSCAFPDDLALTGIALPHAYADITEHKAVTILTVGGSSTTGNAARGAAFTYPARLADHLRELLPGVAVNVINRGQAASATRTRVDRLDRDLAETRPDLVIWAPGSSEAGMSEDPSSFIDSLEEGVAKIRAASADLILMDLQYAPSIARVVNLAQYNSAIAQVADVEDVPLLQRSELMRRWNDNGLFDLDNTPPSERLDAIRRLFDCLAAGLAKGIAEVRR